MLVCHDLMTLPAAGAARERAGRRLSAVPPLPGPREGAPARCPSCAERGLCWPRNARARASRHAAARARQRRARARQRARSCARARPQGLRSGHSSAPCRRAPRPTRRQSCRRRRRRRRRPRPTRRRHCRRRKTRRRSAACSRPGVWRARREGGRTSVPRSVAASLTSLRRTSGARARGARARRVRAHPAAELLRLRRVLHGRGREQHAAALLLRRACGAAADAARTCAHAHEHGEPPADAPCAPAPHRAASTAHALVWPRLPGCAQRPSPAQNCQAWQPLTWSHADEHPMASADVDTSCITSPVVGRLGRAGAVSYTHLTLPTIYSV